MQKKGRRIKKKSLSKEEATELAKRRWSKPLEEDTMLLIREAGFSDPSDAPTHFRLNCQKAATGDIRAIVEYRKWTDKSKSTHEEAAKPQPGEYCNLCGAYNMSGLVIGKDTIKAIKARIEECRNENPEGDYRWEFRKGRKIR